MKKCKTTFYFVNGKTKSIIGKKIEKRDIQCFLETGIKFFADEELKTVINLENVCFFKIEEVE